MINQKGLTPIIIAIAVVVLLTLATGGYFLLQKSNNPTSLVSKVGSAVQNLNPACGYNDPDLCKFINNWKTLKQYSVKSSSSGTKDAPASSMVFEISGEDKTHISISSVEKENYNLITIGDTTYTKDFSDNKWWKQKQPKTKDQVKEKFDFKFESKTEGAAGNQAKTEYKKEGLEGCGSLQCFKYQVISPGIADSQEYIWFDNKDYLLRKMLTKSKDGEETVVEFFYGNINISEPSPTKDAAPNQIVLPGGGLMEKPDTSSQSQKAIEDASKMSQDKIKEMQKDSYNPDSESQ